MSIGGGRWSPRADTPRPRTPLANNTLTRVRRVYATWGHALLFIADVTRRTTWTSSRTCSPCPWRRVSAPRTWPRLRAVPSTRRAARRPSLVRRPCSTGRSRRVPATTDDGRVTLYYYYIIIIYTSKYGSTIACNDVYIGTHNIL